MRTLSDLARHLNFRSGNHRRPRPGLPPMVMLTDELRLPDPFPLVARLPPGSMVIFRHYQMPKRAELAGRLAKLCRARRLRLVIAGDLGLAVSLACGLHLPEGLAAQAQARIRLWHWRRHGLLTAAAHSRKGLHKAAHLGADAALLSPVFPTLSHPGATSLGLLTFRQLVRRASVDIYALGGITTATVIALVGSGAAGIAAIGGFNTK